MSDTTSALAVDSRDSSSEREVLPLTLLDEGLLHLQTARSEWNVQFELAANHRVDEARLRAAVRFAYRRHPLARARLARWRWWDTSYHWDIAPEDRPSDHDELVRVVDCPDDATLDRVRAELYTPPIPLDRAPALRIVLAHRPGGDLVMLCASHLVADGVGAVRLMQTITRAYRGEPDPPDPLPVAAARDLATVLAPRTRRERWARRGELVRRLREALDAPSRIAVRGGSDGHDGAGFGFVRRTVDIGETTTPALVRRSPGTTVNDVLLAALHRTVQAWNAQAGQQTGRVGVMMPVNVRPRDRFWEVVSSLTSMVSVSTTARDRTDLDSAVAAVAAQTVPTRRANRANGMYDLLRLTRKAPLLVKRAAPRLLPLVGDRPVDTAMLSNLGRIPDPPTFDTGPGSETPELWFSPPCDPACSVAVGVATVGERLTLVIRHRHGQFDAHAAEAFTDLLMAQFTAVPAVPSIPAGPVAAPIHVLSVIPSPARRIERRMRLGFFPSGRVAQDGVLQLGAGAVPVRAHDVLADLVGEVAQEARGQ